MKKESLKTEMLKPDRLKPAILMAEDGKGRDRAMDGIRGVAILLVMLGHCIVLNGLEEKDPFLYDIIKSVQMPLFMLVSGFVSAGARGGFSRLVRRAESYLLPFFSWFVVSYFLARIKGLIQGQTITVSLADFAGELKALLFQTDRGLWFFMTLFVITVFMTVSEELSRRFFGGHMAATLVPVGVLYVLTYLQTRTGNTFLSPSLTLQYMPFYVLGYLRSGSRARNASPKVEKIFAALCLALFLVMVILYPLGRPAASGREVLIQMLASFLGSVGMFCLLKVALSGDRVSVLSFLGLYTSEIYVLHFRFARLLGIGRRTDTIWSFRGFFWLIASFLVMSILTAVFIFVLERIPVCRYLLFGKRGKRNRPSKQENKD